MDCESPCFPQLSKINNANPKLLSESQLDNIWAWYASWATGDRESRVPTLKKRDFKKLCAEDLLSYRI